MTALCGRLLPLALLLAWEALSRLGIVDSRFVPAPTDILSCLAAPGTGRDILGQMGYTVHRTLLGFGLGGSAGLGLGLACGIWKPLDEALSPLIEMLRPLPSVAVIPLAILFLGLGNAMNMGVAAFACAWPVFVATRDGVHGVSSELRDTGRMAGLSPARLFMAVTLPACLPSAVTGLRIALGIAVAVVVGSEMVASPDGLGHLAVSASFARNLPLTWAAVLAMGLAGGVCELGFAGLRRLLARLRPGLLDHPGQEPLP